MSDGALRPMPSSFCSVIDERSLWGGLSALHRCGGSVQGLRPNAVYLSNCATDQTMPLPAVGGAAERSEPGGEGPAVLRQESLTGPYWALDPGYYRARLWRSGT